MKLGYFPIVILTFLAQSSLFAQDTLYFGQSKYFKTPQSSWTDAEDYAVMHGGHLVTVDSLGENNFIATNYATNQDYWIGLHTDSISYTNKNNWEWTNESTSDYRNWRQPGQPDAGSGEDRYAVINYFKNNSPYWDNYPNSSFRLIPGIVEVSTATTKLENIQLSKEVYVKQFGDILTLVDNEYTSFSYEIYAVNGVLLKQGTANNNSVNIKELVKGVFFIVVRTKESSICYKFVKG